MAEDNLINSVNKYYLDKVMGLADERDITATEDIFDARGMKLVAKGSRISRTLQERLLQRRLNKPFEASISVDGAVDSKLIVQEAERIIETVAPVHSLVMSTSGALSPIKILSDLQFGSAMSTMLTVIQRGGQKALSHSVMVSLLSIGLAQKRGMSLTDQTIVALAGMLHDIGELYIEPEYLNSKRRLYPHEWRHVVVHPRIGQMLISGLESYPAAVSQAVFEHHERFDGAGYPRQITGNNISIAGQVVSVSELLSGLFMNADKPLQRAELAMKIIPGEHARELVSAVSSAMHASGGPVNESATPTGEELTSVRALYERITEVMESTQHLVESDVFKSKRAKALLIDVTRRASAIQRAFVSTGLDYCIDDATTFFQTNDGLILFETALVTREIQWRLRDVARELSLHSTGLEEGEKDAMQSLIGLFDGEKPAAVQLPVPVPVDAT